MHNLKVTILLFQLISNDHLFWEGRGNRQHEKPGSEGTINFLYQYIIKEVASSDNEFEEVESVLRSKLKGSYSTLHKKKKWTESKSTKKLFLQKNEKWLKL